MISANQTVGLWTILSRVAGKPAKWLCRCQCGTERAIRQCHLVTGGSTSCGCSRSKPLTHGATVKRKLNGAVPEHTSWRGMIDRCSNPNHSRWDLYGGRGIKICERWRDFANFLEDMGPKPTPSHSLDRIDGNGNYEPSNCQWATDQEQARNTSRNREMTIKGRTQLLCEWCNETGLDAATVVTRIKRGWDEASAVLTPKGVVKKGPRSVAHRVRIDGRFQ